MQAGPGTSRSGKALALVTTFEGGGVLGSIVRDPIDGSAREPDDFAKRAWMTVTNAQDQDAAAYMYGIAALRFSSRL
jgi:hypothetical protein